MKKSICLILSAILLFSLCVCFTGCSQDDIRGDISTNNAGQEQNNTQGSTPKETEPELAMGKTTGGTYKSDFLGISCTIPEGWVFYTDEQILEMNNLTKDYLDKDVADALKNATLIYDMMATNLAEGGSISINMEKLSALQILSLDVKATLEGQIPAIKSAYENIGYTDINVQYQKVTVDGKQFDALKLSAKIQGNEFTVITFAFRKGSYLANVSVGTLQTDKMQDLLGCFKVN